MDLRTRKDKKERDKSCTYQLMHGERGIVRLNNHVRDLGRREDRVGHHDTIRVFLAELGHEQRTHSGARASADGVAHLEALEAVACLDFLPCDIERLIDELSALGVVALGPVVTGAIHALDNVVRLEEAAVLGRLNHLDNRGLEVHHHRAWDIPAGRHDMIMMYRKKKSCTCV